MRVCFVITYCIVLSLQICHAEELNPQCEMISELTATYYDHRHNGLTKEQVNEKYRPQVGNQAFIRTADLAINMAFSLPEDKTHDEVVELIYSQCMKYQ